VYNTGHERDNTVCQGQEIIQHSPTKHPARPSMTPVVGTGAQRTGGQVSLTHHSGNTEKSWISRCTDPKVLVTFCTRIHSKFFYYHEEF
jgi:hypothetical protein